ncbi:reverse transcriptase domain-containing protein, partial [Tanacetum coccineum]
PFFETLKDITKENKHDYRWTEKAENAFQELKKMILDLPALTTPFPKETLTLHDAERNYAPLEKMALALRHASRRLMSYFEAHPITVITDQPIKQILSKADTSGLVLISPIKTEYTYALRLNFKSTNNQAEYEALLAGLRIAKKIGVQSLSVNVDSKLVASQINSNYETCKENMIRYLNKAKEYIGCFKIFKIQNIHRNKNQKADVLSKLASVAFNHLTKEILVETLDAPSMDVEEINAVVEDEGETWMTPIINCLERGIWLEDPNEARALRMNINQYVMEERHAFKGKIGSGKGHPARGMDVLGPLPEAPGKMRFVIVAVDYFTKWIEAKPLAKMTRKEVKKFVWDNIVYRTSLKTSNEETPYSLTFKSEAIILAEIGKPTHRTMMIKEGDDNEEEMRPNLDLLTERREAIAIREASRVENLRKLGPKWEGTYLIVEAYQNGSYKLRTMDDRELQRHNAPFQFSVAEHQLQIA